MTETTLPRSPQFYDWLDTLYGLMEWTTDPGGDPAKTTWKCGDPETRDTLGLARKAAASLGADFDLLLAQARELSHVHCDCELIFNCDDRPES